MGDHSTLSVYHNLNEYSVSLAYSGIFTDDLTNNFILFCDDLIIHRKNDPKTATSVNFLLYETFQNIVRHTNHTQVDSKDDRFKGYFGFHNKNNDYRFNSINAIEVEDKLKAIELIESVNNKNADELRSLFRERLKDGALSDKGGAGLGYIQMARKSGKNILYKISNSSDQVDRWHQQIMISEKQETKHTDRIEMTNNQFERMIDNQQILQYKGDFSLERLTTISKIVNANLKSSDRAMKTKKIINQSFVKLFENVQFHGAEINGSVEGALVVSEKQGAFIIEIGNPIHKSDEKQVLKNLEKVRKISGLSTKLSSIQEMIQDNNRFKFKLHALDDQYSFLTVTLKVII